MKQKFVIYIHKCTIFVIFAAILEEKGSNIRIFYKQLKNNIPNETLSMQILQLSSAHHAHAHAHVLRLREEAICRRRIAMLRGRVAREAERGAAHSGYLL